MDYQPLQTRQTTGSYVFPTQNDTPQTDPDQVPLSTNRDLQMPTSPTDRPLLGGATNSHDRHVDSQEENVAKNTQGPTRANSEERLQSPHSHKNYDKSKSSILKLANPSGFGVKKSVTIMDKSSKEKDNPLDFSGEILSRIPDIVDKKDAQNSRRGSLQKLKSFLTREKSMTTTNYELDISFEIDETHFLYESEQLDLLNPNLNFWISEGEKVSSKSKAKAKPKKAFRLHDPRKKDSMSMLSYTETSCLKQLQNSFREMTRDSWVFKPDGNFKISWDLLGMLFIIYEVLMIPLKISFEFENGGLDVFEWLIDAFFITDILMTFNTGYYERGHLVINRRQIAQNYLKGWFWVDLMASFPYPRIIQAELDSEESGNTAWIRQSTRLIRIIRFFRFIRVVRLIRVFKLKSIFSKFDFIEMIPSLNVLFGFLRLSAIILFIAHWIACFWHFLGDTESSDMRDTWITRQSLQDADWTTRYLASIYWAITTMITVGYGDIAPITDGERIYGLFTMLIASGVFAYSMNNINALLIGIDAEEKEYKETIVWVQRYMRKMNLDSQTRAKVANYLRFTLIEANTRKDDETRLLSLLSDSLKDEVVKKINTKVLLSCESLNKLLLNNFSEIFITEMICFFKEKVLSPGEIIFDEEDEHIALYMINSGPVKIVMPSSREIVMRSYDKGDYFGEQEFFTGMDRRYRAKAGNDFVSLFLLRRSDFLHTVSDFPSEKEKFFQLKDKMQIYKDFSALEQRCQCCNKLTHLSFECPYMHYLGDRTKYIQEQIEESYKSKANFKRITSRPRVRNSQTLELCALRIRANFAKEIEALENETVNTDFLHSSSIRTEDMSIRKTNEVPTSLNQLKSLKTLSDADDGEFMRSPSMKKKMSRVTQKINKNIKSEVEFDAVYSFKSYFPYNNVENVLSRINEKLKLAMKFKKMRILKKILSVGKGLGAGKSNSPFKKSPSKVPSFTPTHSTQTGKLNFTFLYNPHYDQRVQSYRGGSSLLRQIPESMEMDPSSELFDRIADEQVVFNKKTSRENEEFTKRMHIKLMPGEIIQEDSIELEDKDVSITYFESGDYKSKLSKISKDGFKSQDEVNDALDIMIEKYGANYIQQILREKLQ